MKVAFTTEDLQHVDAHFGWAKNLAIYDVSPEAYQLAEVVQFDGDLAEDGNEDKLQAKIDALQGVAIVYVSAIGGSAAARVVNSRVHPVKVPTPEKISDILDKLLVVLQGTPPPWLRKAMNPNQAADPRRFEEYDD